VDDARLAARLGAAAATFAEAVDRSRDWLADALGGWRLEEPTPAAARLAATAAYALLANTCTGPGLLAGAPGRHDGSRHADDGRLASYPSRGGYPVHFLWDACFHTLGLQAMTPALAADALEVLADNLRPDGKLPHFVAATWVRPGASQPPLLGWAAERLVAQRDDLALARRLLPALDANNRWWWANRMTRYGLIFCGDPFESGWDDTPRLDDGPILALDMNAYLLRQLRVTARLATRLGDRDAAAANTLRAERLDAALLRHLYDPDRNLFLDADAETAERHPLLTPAAFLPLWAGVSLDGERARAMVRDTLLDPDRLFGAVPFPSVAYDEGSYQPDRWWRGPAWPPIMLLMIELLHDLGFAAEATDAEERVHRLLLRDGELHELFDSRTGAGLGQRHQGWTAAAFLWLAARRADRARD
jgi:glycogen debranching enzyme